MNTHPPPPTTHLPPPSTHHPPPTIDCATLRVEQKNWGSIARSEHDAAVAEGCTRDAHGTRGASGTHAGRGAHAGRTWGAGRTRDARRTGDTRGHASRDVSWNRHSFSRFLKNCNRHSFSRFFKNWNRHYFSMLKNMFLIFQFLKWQFQFFKNDKSSFLRWASGWGFQAPGPNGSPLGRRFKKPGKRKYDSSFLNHVFKKLESSFLLPVFFKKLESSFLFQDF